MMCCPWCACKTWDVKKKDLQGSPPTRSVAQKKFGQLRFAVYPPFPVHLPNSLSLDFLHQYVDPEGWLFGKLCVPKKGSHSVLLLLCLKDISGWTQLPRWNQSNCNPQWNLDAFWKIELISSIKFLMHKSTLFFQIHSVTKTIINICSQKYHL